MYPGKGSIQEVMGLSPRSVTKTRNPNHMRITFYGLSQISKPEVTSRGLWPNVACMCILCNLCDHFYNLILNGLGGEGRALLSEAARFLLPKPHSLLYICLPGL